MSTGTSLRQLAELVDVIEATGVEIDDLTVPGASGDAIRADIQVRIPLDDGADAPTPGEPVDVSKTATDVPSASNGEGGIDPPETDPSDVEPPETEPPETEPPETDPVDGDPAADESSDGEGVVVCRAPACSSTFDTERAMKIHRTKVHGDSAESEVPRYRDPDALADVYGKHDSFREMTEALDVDVSHQTVRRYMIQHGVHEPDASAEDEGSSGAQNGTDPGGDDVDLPDGTTPEDLKEAVATADTLYETQETLGLGREETAELLETFDLLELVHGRVNTKHQRDELKEEIDERLGNAVTSD